MRLRVASFNIRNGLAFDGCQSWPFRRRETAAAIADLDADVVGLQEVYGFQLRWLLGRLGRYDASGRGRGRGDRGERCPILFDRHGTRVLDQWTRWYGDAPDQPGSRLSGASHPRIATMVRIEVEGFPDAIQVVNTHFDTGRTGNRLRSADQLADWLDPAAPRVVMGDFNAGPPDPLFDRLADTGLVSALPVDAGGTFHGFRGGRDGPRIDHILVSSHWEVEAGEVGADDGGRRLPSDHWPVVADLRLRPWASRAAGES